MAFEIIRNDITKVHADAIVNTANPNVAIGSGVDAAIYKAAGEKELLFEREKIGVMKPGEIAVTPAFNLDAKYIIHTVGPVWQGGDNKEAEIVSLCYSKSLQKAKELGCESIAFPLISSGTYGFPKDVALKTAVSQISDFLFNNEMTVYLVVYDKESFEISGKVFSDISSFIDEVDVTKQAYRNRRIRSLDILKDKLPQFEVGSSLPKLKNKTISEITYADEIEVNEEDIEDIIKNKKETFQEYLFRLIDRKGLEDKDVYKKANIDRKHFSKIKSNVNYHPSKRTVLAFAIALELNLDETKDLLLRAGIALSPSNTFDIIMTYCIEHQIRDIYEINCILFKYNQPILGA